MSRRYATVYWDTVNGEAVIRSGDDPFGTGAYGSDDSFGTLNPQQPATAATSTSAGIIELATQAEVDTGTDAVRAVTPATLKARPSQIEARTSDPSTPFDGQLWLRTDL